MLVGVIACGGGSSHTAAAGSGGNGASASGTPLTPTTGNGATPGAPTPTHTSASTVIGGTNPSGGASVVCKTHISAGNEDDGVRMALACTVTHALTSDTSFTLHFGLINPVGRFIPFTSTCGGHLDHGTGSCSQTYQLIYPFALVPGPVSGTSLPSRKSLGPVTPTA
ncbi:MAG: hypothetical protein ACHQ4H_14730 [Ktedonobacterales bacterium]